MASSVFFKFKSHKESQRIPFDGTGISVFELKREVITLNKLGDGRDFDLSIYNADSNEEYKDDTEIIPRGSSITGARRPASMKGRGNGARYVSGRAPVKALSSHRLEKSSGSSVKPISMPAVLPGYAHDTTVSEEDRIAQMLAVNADQWKQQSDQMAGAKRVYNNNNQTRGGKTAVPDRPLPSNYICYRCGQKGHFIQACPTNDDPNYENKVRIKRTTGIPRSFLKTVERPLALDGGGIDGKSLPPGVMVNADGDFVIAEPDAKAWERFQAKQQINTAARKAEEALSKELEEKGLACTIDRKLYNKPTRTPCCGKTFCHDCISNSLMENDFRCPECDQTPVLLDDLIDDPEMEERVMAHKTPENGEGKAASPTSTAAGSPRRSPSANREKAITIKTEPGTGDSLHLAVPGDNARKVTSLPDTTIIRPSSTDSSVSRKRKADSDLDNSRASKAPSPVIEREPSPISEGDERSQKEGALPSTTPAGEDPSQPEVGTDIEKQDGDAASPSNLIKETVASVDRSATSTPLLPRIQDTPALPIATTDITTVPVGGVGMPALGNNANANMNWMTGMTPAMMNQMLAMGSLNNNGTNMNTTTTPAFNPAAMMMMMNGGLANPMLGMGTMGMDLMNPMMMNMGGMGTMGSMGMGMMGMGFGMGMPLGMNGMNTGQQFGGNNQFGTQQQQQQQYQPQQQQQGYNQGGRGNGGYQQQQQQWRGARGNRGRRGGNWRNEQVHH